MRPQKHYIERHFRASKIDLTKARLLKHDLHFHNKYRCKDRRYFLSACLQYLSIAQMFLSGRFPDAHALAHILTFEPLSSSKELRMVKASRTLDVVDHHQAAELQLSSRNRTAICREADPRHFGVLSGRLVSRDSSNEQQWHSCVLPQCLKYESPPPLHTNVCKPLHAATSSWAKCFFRLLQFAVKRNVGGNSCIWSRRKSVPQIQVHKVNVN